MAFDPDKYLQETPDFDPDSYLAEPAEKSPEIVAAENIAAGRGYKAPSFLENIKTKGEDALDTAETIATKGAQGATFGTMDELGAGIGSAVDFIRRQLGGETEEERVNKLLKEQGFTGDIGKTVEEKDILSQYREMRDVSREREKELEEASPVLSTVAEIGGGIVPAIASGGAAAAANIGKVGLKESIKAGAKAGAKFGAGEALGRTEADLTKGEVGEAAKDVLVGATGGAVLGGALPVAGTAIKKVIPKDIGKKVHDVMPRIMKKIVAAERQARAGEAVVGDTVEKTQLKAMEDIAKSVPKLLTETKDVANKMIKESLDSNTKIKVTDQFGKYVDDLNKVAKKFAPDSDEAKQIQNAIQTINNQRQEILGSAMADPSLLTKKQAYEKLLKKVETLKFQNEIGVPQAKAIDSLFDRAAKLKGEWNPDSVDARRIMEDFNLADTNAAIEMAKDIATLKIKRPKIDPKTGEITEATQELTALIKKYSPEIKERGDTVYLSRGPGKVRESEILKTRPEMVEAPLEVTPEQLYSTEKAIGDIGRKSDPGGELYKIQKDMRQTLQEGLPEDLAGKFQEGMRLQSGTHKVQDITGELVDRYSKDGKTGTTQALANLLEQEHGFGGKGPAGSRIVRKELQKALSEISPEFAEKFSTDVATTARKIDLNRVGDTAGLDKQSLIGGGIEALGVRGGVGVGKVFRGIDWGFRAVENLVNVPKEKLMTMSQQVAEANPKLSNFLKNLSTVESETRKKALLFSASQQPDLADDIEKLYGLDKDDEN